jgi:hypothetical protein
MAEAGPGLVGGQERPEPDALRTELRRQILQGGAEILQDLEIRSGEEEHHRLGIALVEEFVGRAFEVQQAEVSDLDRLDALEDAEPVEVLGFGGADGVVQGER